MQCYGVAHFSIAVTILQLNRLFNFSNNREHKFDLCFRKRKRCVILTNDIIYDSHCCHIHHDVCQFLKVPITISESPTPRNYFSNLSMPFRYWNATSHNDSTYSRLDNASAFWCLHWFAAMPLAPASHSEIISYFEPFHTFRTFCRWFLRNLNGREELQAGSDCDQLDDVILWSVKLLKLKCKIMVMKTWKGKNALYWGVGRMNFRRLIHSSWIPGCCTREIEKKTKNSISNTDVIQYMDADKYPRRASRKGFHRFQNDSVLYSCWIWRQQMITLY